MTKLPTWNQWKQLFKVLNKKEQRLLIVCLSVAVVSFGIFAGSWYITSTASAPADGGTFVEGVVGQPRFINPIYGETNDTDRAIIDLVFSGLMTYDTNGKIVNDLAKSYTVSDDGKTYDIQLKDNIFWHDGRELTADDIIFTVKTIQNSDYKSPLRANWIDVDVQKISNTSVRFSLKTSYNSFLENLTVKIIPQHIWANITPENFALSSYNLQPVGSGPFAFSHIEQTNAGFIKALNLQSNRRYYNHPPYISKFSFQFFEKKEDLVKAINAHNITGFTLTAFDNNEASAEQQIKQGWSQPEKFTSYSLSLPRYFAVFFNSSKDSLFADANVRLAMSTGVNKNELAQKISNTTKQTISIIDSPALPDFYGYHNPSKPISFDQGQSKTLLDKVGFKETATGTREKPNPKKPAFQFRSYLKVGSNSTEVAQLQSCLTRLDNSFKILIGDETNGKYGKGTESAVDAFQRKYLPDTKPTGETGAATRTKLNQLCLNNASNVQQLKFTITTLDQPQLVQTAQMLKDYWKMIGADVDIKAVSLTDLKPIIKTRAYDALLYGEALGAQPDLYPFWHSSQKFDPGLNLSYYENKDVDKLLRDARQTTIDETKTENYEKLQDLIIKDAPALFLYNPTYMYWVAQNIHGIDTTKVVDPAKRFSNITNWYVGTKRIFK